MKKHEFRELVDQNLSGLVWDEEKRQTVLYAVQKEEKPVKKFTATFVLIAAVICLSVTALAAGLVFSSQVDAFKLAEKARDGYLWHYRLHAEHVLYPYRGGNGGRRRYGGLFRHRRPAGGTGRLHGFCQKRKGGRCLEP